jgi:hypothetical protein
MSDSIPNFCIGWKIHNIALMDSFGDSADEHTIVVFDFIVCEKSRNGRSVLAALTGPDFTICIPQCFHSSASKPIACHGSPFTSANHMSSSNCTFSIKVLW